MEQVRILGIDPSLRFTGLSEISWNADSAPTVLMCDLLRNPPKFTGTEAILNMLRLVSLATQRFKDYDKVVIESPAAIFHASWSAGALMPVCHIAGGATVAFGLDKAVLARPKEWNGGKKKEVTHKATQEILGDCTSWTYLSHIKNEKHLEHILDAASIALWYLKSKYIEN